MTNARLRSVLASLLLFSACLPIASADTVIYVLRHAEKSIKPEADPALTPAGRKRAENLSSLLCQGDIDAVFSTDFTRTRQTVQPLAVCLDLRVQIYDPGNPRELATSILHGDSRRKIVVVGHSNTVAGILAGFGVSEPPILSDRDYGDLFKVTIDDDGRVSLEHERY